MSSNIPAARSARLSVEGRLTVSNMAIEHGARAGLIAADDVTFDWIKGRPMAPKGTDWDAAVAWWRSLATDPGARYDKVVVIDAADIAPSVTWGTSPEDVVPITGVVPDPMSFADPAKQVAAQKSLDYMGLTPGMAMTDIPVENIFIGSCTNSRIEDLRAAAAVLKGRKKAANVKWAIIVPGSGLVKEQAEAEGLDRIFIEAGLEWREPGCSACLAMNPDKVPAGERCASTSNRNFVGRQGPGSADASGFASNGGSGGGCGETHRCAGVNGVSLESREDAKTRRGLIRALCVIWRNFQRLLSIAA